MSKKLQLGKMRLKQAISICLLIACCLILTTSASAQGCDSEYIANANPVCQLDDCENYCMDWLPQGDLDCQTRPGYTETARCCDDSPNPDITQRCSKGCIGGVNPTCQPADCGVYCMQERSEGNADCQNRPDFHVPDEDGVPQQQRAKCCDVAPCSAALGGVCEHSITIDPADPNHDGGECIYLNSEDRTDFFCPMGWTHVAIGDQDCAAKKQNTGGEYQGTITDSMCCCAPMIDSCNRLTPTGYKPDYVYGSRGDADILEDMSKPWYAVVSISKYGELSFRKSYGFNIEYDKPITDTEAGDQCVPTQPGTMGGLGPGQGDCDGNCDLTGNQACAEGLVCSDDAPGRKDYCCPAGQTKYYHSTKKCCTSAPPFIPIGATPKSCTSNSQCTGGRKCILVEGEGYCVAAYPGSCSSDSYCATEVSSIFTLCRASIDGTKYCFVANADCSSCDSTPTPDGHLQKCMGDCDRNPNAACDDDECEPGLTCTSDHCCPPGTSWDNTKNQCCYANSINSENYNGFIRIVNACNNGTVECGWIKRYGPGNYGIVFSEQYCDENNPQNVGPQRTALNYSYIPQCMRSGEEDEPRRFTVLMKVDRVYADNNTARLSPQFENLTVVPGVYRVIAVNDSDLISLKRRIALEYENARRSNTPISTPNTEAYYDYCTTYILARGCDMPFGINVTNMCKNLRMEGGGLKENYTYQVENMNFSACMWEIIDGGKYYDFPGVYLTVMNKSRHGANLGLMYYYVNSLEPRGTTHMVNPSGTPGGQEANVRWLLNWNKKSAGRILGCRSDSNEFWSDTCSPGDFTCSLGAALANAYTQGFRADKIKSNLSKKCGYFEHEQPKTSNVPGQTADYFQYNDLDDENKEDDPFDVGEVYDDKSFDFELGVPDRKYLVNQSIESIKTEISALFVDHSSVRWKGIYYREALTFYSQCRPGTDTSKKYFKIPYGRGSYSGGQWVNGPWYGGTMYQYIYKNGFFNYTTYPAKTDVQFWPFSGWPDRETCNNPVIFYNNERLTNYDTPAATDRYWIINPKEQATSRPDLQCTRPAHSGNLGGSSEPLYYTNPGGYNAPGDKPRVDPFNEGGTSDLLKYYRQYNKRTLWANVFKVTPEFHNRPPEDDLCAPETESTNGGIGAGQGDCDGSCSNKLCEQGLVCADVPWSTTEYCCPEAQKTYINDKWRCCSQDPYFIQGSCNTNDDCLALPGPGFYLCISLDSGKKCAQAEPTSQGCGTCPEDQICMNTLMPGFHTPGADNYCIKIDTSKCATCPTTPPQSGFLGTCQAGCTGVAGTNPCASDVCEPTLHCDETFWGADYCCPAGAWWDNERKCCLKCGVFEVDLYDSEYCEIKKNTGSDCRCGEGEGGCYPENVQAQCDNGLICKDNPYTWGIFGNDNGCCRPDQTFVGNGCIPPSITQNAVIYTRTGGGLGGGSIYFHFAGGGNLPNETEAGGNRTITEYCVDKYEPIRDAWGQCYYKGSEQNFWSTDICAKAWDYMRDQGGIWDEQKNLGNDVIIDEEVENRLKINIKKPNGNEGPEYCDGFADEGFWCTDASGCNCHPNYARIQGPGAWVFDQKPDGQPVVRNDSGDYFWRIDNPYKECDAALDGDSEPPTECGQTCRKQVLKDWYKNTQMFFSWFNYTIIENGAITARGRMEGGSNVLPMETPWNFLHVGNNLLEHNLRDTTTAFNIQLSYTAKHSIIRQPLAQTCKWDGCSARQSCYYEDKWQICPDGTKIWITHSCQYAPCASDDGSKCTEDPYWPQTVGCWCDIDGDGELEYTQCIEHRQWMRCMRCWGAWSSERCDYEISNETADPVGARFGRPRSAIEEINDTSTVYARPYGDHLETSRPLTGSNTQVNINVRGYVDYGWGDSSDKLDYRKNRVNGSLTVSAIATKDQPQKDLLGGFELLLPDTAKVTFIAKDYPPIHDLYILDSTPGKELILLNKKMQDMMQMDACIGNVLNYYDENGDLVPKDYGNNYAHYIINPLKKYYHAIQGATLGNTRVFFSAIGYPYSWDLKPICTNNSFIDWSKREIGLLRNFHEDESKYWDFVGFYPQPRDLNTIEYGLEGNTAGETETYTEKKTSEEEADIRTAVSFNYAKNEYTLSFSTTSIETEKFKNARLRIFSDFRYIDINPFKTEAGSASGTRALPPGTKLDCEHDHLTETVGSVHKDVYYRHPVELSVEKMPEGVEDTTVSFKVVGTDQCPPKGPVTQGKVFLYFDYPYTGSSRNYDLGTLITLNKKTRKITFKADYSGFGMQYQESTKLLEVETEYRDSIDYAYENIVVLAIVFLALMSYRFFTSKRLDIQDMWDEWKGKK